MTKQELLQTARETLEANWRAPGFSVPSGRLYPFQWNWDSGFTSIGNAHINPQRALREMETLFTGQWANGMVPHIIFHSEKETTYFPNFDFWDTTVNAGAPQRPKTSGITQPAVHGFVLEHLLNTFPDDAATIATVKALFPRVVNSHRFLYIYRDPEREGLMFMYHPWETGRDNSPLWDASMDRIVIDKGTLPAYTRQDTKIAAADERPTADQYDRYVHQLELGKRNGYDGPGIFAESEILIQDTLMNALLIKSNASLIRIGQRFGFDVGELEEWQQQSTRAFQQKLWHEELQTFVPYDVRAGAQIAEREIGSFTALSAGIASDKQAKILNDYLQSLHDRGFYLCPSFDPDSPHFDSRRYWRGPIWPHMNWLIHDGLKNYGFGKMAEVVRNDAIHLIREFGFYEYFDCQKNTAPDLTQGYGGDQFSWTAACLIDLIET
ncbi:MGH1-like glycoside hydrolase domain-containing protein [Neolewinella aurantiaca]|nr:trehalase family glycosidase [Neolewinella aurantiaca]